MQRIFGLFFILILFFSARTCPAQDKHARDSLLTRIRSLPEDTSLLKDMIGISHQYSGANNDSAFSYGRKAFELAKKLGHQKLLGDAYNNLGDLYWYKSDFAASSLNYLQALRIFESLGSKSEMAECYRNIGWIYVNKNDFRTALIYHEKAMAINLELDKKIQLSQNYNDIAIVYSSIKEYEKAISYFQKAIQISIAVKDTEGELVTYGNMSVAYDRIGKGDLAVEYTKKALKLASGQGNFEHISFEYAMLANYYTKQGKTEEALEALSKGIPIAKEARLLPVLKDCYETCADIYAKQKNYLQAYRYTDSASWLKDSIYNENNSRQVNEMTAKYESEKKELMISSLEKDKVLAGDKLQREQTFKIFLIIFCLLVAALAFVLFRGNIQKKKVNEELSGAYRQIEVKNKDITDSINYSKRIQDATLPSRSLLHKLFPESFILFEPKDIVSGDFFWYTEKAGRRLIAACDCTGHGVPGALMSMIGNNLLNQIVNESGITSPDEVLNHLHEEVRKALKQNEQHESRDGMDIAFLCFTDDGFLECAAAQRPVWIVRDGGLTEIKGNKFSIGGLQTEEKRTFTKHRIQLLPGDVIYISSDGYADQSGGPNGKKFLSKQLKNLLVEISDKPAAEQEKNLQQTLHSWQGNTEQVDDVLVIGIKI